MEQAMNRDHAVLQRAAEIIEQAAKNYKLRWFTPMSGYWYSSWTEAEHADMLAVAKALRAIWERLGGANVGTEGVLAEDVLSYGCAWPNSKGGTMGVNWRSVEDEAPGKGQDVLACKKDAQGRWHRYACRYDDDGFYTFSTGSQVHPTHWMPWPASPDGDPWF